MRLLWQGPPWLSLPVEDLLRQFPPLRLFLTGLAAGERRVRFLLSCSMLNCAVLGPVGNAAKIKSKHKKIIICILRILSLIIQQQWFDSPFSHNLKMVVVCNLLFIFCLLISCHGMGLWIRQVWGHLQAAQQPRGRCKNATTKHTAEARSCPSSWVRLQDGKNAMVFLRRLQSELISLENHIFLLDLRTILFYFCWLNLTLKFAYFIFLYRNLVALLLKNVKLLQHIYLSCQETVSCPGLAECTVDPQSLPAPSNLNVECLL